MSGSGDVTAESVGISLVCIPDSSVEFELFEEFLRCGFGLLDSCSTRNTSDSIELSETLVAIFKILQTEVLRNNPP